MINAGYMYKTVVTKPVWLNTDQVTDICSVSGCVSEDFGDWINFWKHNGYWFFDSPEIIREIAAEQEIDLSKMHLFFYRTYEFQWHTGSKTWKSFEPENSFATAVAVPEAMNCFGYDVTSYSAQNSAECSPLSCNHMAEEIPVNSHCLLPNLATAKRLTESGAFADCEPGPYRILEVNGVDDA